MKKSLWFLILAFYCTLTYSQQEAADVEGIKKYNNDLSVMSAFDSVYLSGLPELPVPDRYKGNNAPPLPNIVDNSQHSHFRPPYNQAGYSCGQAALVGYNFTYEINRERNLSGNTSESQYPTHFTWNFDNAGNNYGGVSFFHSIEILREVGNPNCAVYGGMSSGGETRWMSGYDNYYHAMQNRITTAYQLKVNTVEGLQHLKYWLYDHMEGSETGGLASFYANQPWWPIMQQLPSGTPEAGKYVTLSWVASSHALTIVGYHDSIRWDYNEDGQYTNHIDINNDGIVNMKDWEIGGLKFVNSYGGVPNWGDNGFCYMMYKTLADEYGNGGIWNNVVTLLDVKENCSPQLTLKVELNYNRRNCIKVTAGFANDPNAGSPDQILEFPILNFQGSTLYMQGGSNETDKYIEIGLDISPFLSFITPGEEFKLFFNVVENDPGNAGQGEILSCTLMDYSDILTHKSFIKNPVPITNNSTTTITTTYSTGYEKVNILNNSLPPAFQGEFYNVHLYASDGEAPYFWDIDFTYDELIQTIAFPPVTGTQLFPPNNDESHVMQALDFSFPFYGEYYDTLWLHTDGTIQLQNDIFHWYYLIKEDLLFPRNINIAPFLSDLYLYNNQGIWYEGDENSAIFFWKASVNGQTTTNLNFAVKLFPSGIIEFYYGVMDFNNGLVWWNGLSRGNCVDYQYSSLSGSGAVNENTMIRYYPVDYPMEMSLSKKGTFSGIPLENYSGKEIKFKVTDNSFISNTKTLTFSSKGIDIIPLLVSGNDAIPEAGETAVLSTKLINYENWDLTQAAMKVFIDDTLFLVIDSTENIGTLNSGDSVFLHDAFTFEISPNVPDGKIINIQTLIYDSGHEHHGNIFYTVSSPDIIMNEVIVDDGLNGILDPGETASLKVEFENTGGIVLTDISFQLFCFDNNIIINNGQAFIDSISSGSLDYIFFNITANESIEVGSVIDFTIKLNATSGYNKIYQFELMVGRFIEDFESAGLQFYPWGSEGVLNWGTHNLNTFEGDYAVRSPLLTHNEESGLIIDIDVISNGKIKFYKKVSCEDDANNDNYDYLMFSVNGIEKGRWDGESDWELASFDIEPGLHRLKWIYHKDNSVSAGLDAAFIDFIHFPPCQFINHELTALPNQFIQYLKPSQSCTDSILITNTSQSGSHYQLICSAYDTLFNANGTESLEGSEMICIPTIFNTGDTIVFEFRAYNSSTDDEWFKDIYIDFPEGIYIDSATNFIGGSEGEMQHDSTTGNGAIIHWHGENPDGYGVVKGGQTAIAKVFTFVEENFSSNALINFEIEGDIYGSEPHFIIGSFKPWILGPKPLWLNVNPKSGLLSGNQNTSIRLDFNSHELPDSTYKTTLLLLDNFQHIFPITVQLIVDTELMINHRQVNENIQVNLYPNPAHEYLHINLLLTEREVITMSLLDNYGNKVKSILHNQEMAPGPHYYSLIIKTGNGISFKKGVYYLLIQGKNSQTGRKVILN